MTDKDLITAARTLLERVEYDCNGTMGKGGNGGLLNSATIHAAGQLRITLDRHEKAAATSHRDWQAIAEHYRLAMLEVERQISAQPLKKALPGQPTNKVAKLMTDLSLVLWEARQKVIFNEPLATLSRPSATPAPSSSGLTRGSTADVTALEGRADG